MRRVQVSGLRVREKSSILIFGWRKFSNIFAEDGGGGGLSEVEIKKGKQVDHKTPLSQLGESTLFLK